MTATFSLKPSFVIASLLAAATTLPAYAEAENEGFSGNLRTGYISTENDSGDRSKSSAIGGKFGYVSPQWSGVNFGATVYATETLGEDDETSFFGSDGEGYAILGEAYLQATLGDTSILGGRFEFDSPFADTDDIRMIPNTFQGAVLTNNSRADTTLHLGHLRKWAGVDTDEREKFRDLNNNDGVTLLGAIYEGFDAITLQAWYYQAKDFAQLSYLEAVYSANNYELGVQYSDQNDDSSDKTGPDGDVYGIYGSVNVADFTLTTAYNDVDGTVTNGFGGGPFFTSADDHTIDGTLDQSAIAVGAEYGGIESLTLGVLSVNFDKGEDETNYYAAYEVNESLSFELIHADMNKDGNSTRLVANLSF